MNNKKISKSFADALLSADPHDDPTPKPKKVKLKVIKDKNPNKSKLLTNTKTLSTSSKYSRSTNEKLHSSKQKKRKFLAKNKIQSNEVPSTSSSNRRKSKTDQDEDEVNPFALSTNSLQFTSSDSDDNEAVDYKTKASHLPPKAITINEGNKFSANMKAGTAAADKLVEKLLRDEKERETNTKLLHSVDDDLELFDLHLKGNLLFLCI